MSKHAMKRGSSSKSGGQTENDNTDGHTMYSNATDSTLQILISECNLLYCDYAACHRLNHHTTTLTLLHPTYWIELNEKLLNVMHGKQKINATSSEKTITCSDGAFEKALVVPININPPNVCTHQA